jgi:hypothetical protein
LEKPLLVFESAIKCDQIEVHGDEDGIRMLIKQLEILLSKEEHIHLKTPSWGGDELSEEVQGENHHIINHVKIFCWRK